MACNPEATSLSSSTQSVANDTSSSSNSNDQNLFSSINRDKVWSMNTSSPDSGKRVIKPWDKRFDATEYTQSLSDEEMKGMLVINIPFVCPVRVRSILLNPGRGEFAVRVSSRECDSLEITKCNLRHWAHKGKQEEERNVGWWKVKG